MYCNTHIYANVFQLWLALLQNI